jgi:hypothetical protein
VPFQTTFLYLTNITSENLPFDAHIISRAILQTIITRIIANMPIRLEDGSDAVHQAGERVAGGVKGMWEGFTDFALQDNVLEVAVGLMYEVPMP